MRLLAATVTALLAVAGSSSQLPERGAVTGTVTLTTAVRGVPLATNVYQPRAVGRHDPGRTAEILNVLVFLKDASFSGTLPTSRQVVEQVNESFVPRVVAVTRIVVFDLGSSVTFCGTNIPGGSSTSDTGLSPPTADVVTVTLAPPSGPGFTSAPTVTAGFLVGTSSPARTGLPSISTDSTGAGGV